MFQVILLKDAFPINILSSLKGVPEIVTVYCATSNPVEKIFVDTVQGRAILGVDDGFRPKSIETDKDIGGYGPEGIVFNSSNKSIYIVSISINSILKYDEYANKILASLQPIVHSQPLQDNKLHSGIVGKFRERLIEFFAPIYSPY